MQADYDTAVQAISGVKNYWPLTDGSDTTYADKVGSKDLTAGATPSRVNGPDGSANYAVDFAATANSVGTASSFSITQTHTVAYWVRCNAAPANDAMSWEWNYNNFAQYDQHDLGYPNIVDAFLAGSACLFGTYYGNGVTGSLGSAFNENNLGTNTWKFLVHTVDPSVASGQGSKVYLNGSLLVGSRTNSYTQTGTPGSGYLGVGGRNNAGTRQLPFNGALNGVALFDKVLSSTEISTLYAAMSVPVRRQTVARQAVTRAATR